MSWVIVCYNSSLSVTVVGTATGRPFQSRPSAERALRRLETEAIRGLVIPIEALSRTEAA